MKISKLIIGIMVLVLVVAAFSLTAPDSMAFDIMGPCGDNLTYFYIEGESGGKLFIVGSGSMYNYSSSNPAPWHEVAGQIVDIQFSYDVTSVGDYAFADCGSLSNISGAFSIYTIGSHAFDGCYSMPRMPPYATYIGSYAFRNCSSLGAAYLSGSGLGAGAFSGCSSLSSVSLPGSLSSIPDYAFYGCYSLSSIDIPDGVTYIGESAFESCSSLSSVDIPSDVTEIGINAFKKCSYLRTFAIPEAINEVPEGLLSGCKRLQTLTLHDGITKLGDYSFEGCEALLAVRFPDSVKELGEGVFSGCSSLMSIIFNDELTAISEKAFSECTALKVIDLPADIETLGVESFSGCTALIELELDEGVKNIEDRAFADCTGLKVCVLPTSLRTVGEAVFTGCTSLRSVRYAGYLAKWKNVIVGADNPLLADDKISTDYIDGGNMVNGNVWSVSVDGVLNIGGDGAMQNFEAGKAPWHNYSDTIKTITIDSRMPYIGAYAFADLENVTSAVLPDVLTRLSEGMFMNCNNLRTVEGTEHITNIGASAFENCFSLSIDMPTVITLGERAFANCGGVESIDLSCEKIGAEAFENCVDLKAVIIRNSVQEIGDGAFRGCSIEFADYVGTDEELAELKTGANNEPLTDVLSISYYVKNIYVGSGATKKSAMAAIGDRTFDIIEIDLNPSRSEYVCVGYSLTNDITEALTDIRLYTTSLAEPDGSVVSGGATYYLLSKPVCVDENGYSVYLCTTKDTSAGEPIIMIGVRNDDNGKGSFVDGESWSAVQSINSESSSLTGTAKNIRLYYTNDPDADLSQPLGNSALTASLVAIGISVLGGIAILIFMKSKRGEEEAENKPRPAFKDRVRAIPAKIKGLFKKSSSDEKGEKGKKNSAVKAKKPDKQKKTDKNGQKTSKKKSGGKNDRESETVELPRDTAVKDEAEKANGNANPTGKHLSGGKGRIASLRGKRVNQKNGDNNGIAAEMEAPKDEPQKKPKKAGKGRKSKKKDNKKYNKKDKTVTVPETEDEITQETVSVK